MFYHLFSNEDSSFYLPFSTGIARKILAEKVDIHVNGATSRTVLKSSIIKSKKKKGEDKKRRNRVKKLKLKLEAAEEEGGAVKVGCETVEE